MKKAIFLCVGLFLLSTFEASAIKIKIRGSGGVQSDGKNHKVCPDKSENVCATIEVNWSDIKDIVKGGSTTLNNVDITISGEAPQIFENVSCYLNDILEVNTGREEIIVTAHEVTIKQ